MTLQVWANYVKRKNSTAQPSHAADTTLNVVLKNTTDLFSPTFLISGAIEQDIVNINYAAWASHYYFVNKVRFLSNKIAALECEMDTLATHKGDILLQTFFIERATQNYNSQIYDPLVAQTAENALITQVSSDQMQNWSENGIYVVRVVGNNAVADNQVGVTTYVLAQHELNALLEVIFSEGNYDILSDKVVKSFFNPFQYILSIMWFPFRLQAFSVSSSTQEIVLGWFHTGRYAFTLDNFLITSQVSVARPRLYYNDFRDSASNWITLRMLLPGIGIYPINPIEYGNESVRVNYAIDILTGECLATLYPNVGGVVTGGFITQLSGNMGVPIQIGQVTAQYAQAATSAVGALGNLLTGKLGDAFSDALQATTEICQPTPSVNGSAGNAGALKYTQGKVYVSAFTRKAQPIAVNEIGRPVMKADLLSKYSGYVKCHDASIILKGTLQEKETINGFLNGGFFIE